MLFEVANRIEIESPWHPSAVNQRAVMEGVWLGRNELPHLHDEIEAQDHETRRVSTDVIPF